MELVSLSSLRVTRDNKRKLPSPSGERLYPLFPLTTSSRREDLLTRSEMYFGLSATLRRSVKVAELLQSLTMWFSIWTRRLFEKKSHISHKVSISASDSPNSFITSSLSLGFHSLSESERSSKTLPSSCRVNLRPIVT